MTAARERWRVTHAVLIKLVPLLICGTLAGTALASPSPPNNGTVYLGSARILVLSAAEAKYNKVVSSHAQTASAGKRLGFKSGWEVQYQDTSRTSNAQADATIYVYDNQQHAAKAAADTCRYKPCKARAPLRGVQIKYASYNFNGVPAVAAITNCRNLYVAVVTAATTETPRQLGYDAGYVAGAIYAKAIAAGMAPCDAKAKPPGALPPTSAQAGQVFARGRSSGDYAIALASGSTNHPATISVRILAAPNQTVDASWNLVCSRGLGAGSKDGQFSARTPVTKRLTFPMENPDSCTAAASDQLSDSGNVTVLLLHS